MNTDLGLLMIIYETLVSFSENYKLYATVLLKTESSFLIVTNFVLDVRKLLKENWESKK